MCFHPFLVLLLSASAMLSLAQHPMNAQYATPHPMNEQYPVRSGHGPQTHHTYATAFSKDKGTVYVSTVFCYEDSQCPTLTSWALSQFINNVPAFDGQWANVHCTDISADKVTELRNGTVVRYRNEGKKVVVVNFPKCK